MQREQKGQRLTYGAEAATDFVEGRYFFGVEGKIHTYALEPARSHPQKKEVEDENYVQK